MRKYTRVVRTALLFGVLLFSGTDPINAWAADQAAAEAQAAAEIQAAIEAQAAAEAQTEAEVRATIEAQAAEAQAAVNSPAEQPETPVIKKSSAQRTTSILTDQIKKDIEDSLKESTQEAVINGYLSLLNKEYILKDELDLELVSIGNSHQLEERSADAITRMIKDAKKEGMYISITSSYRTYLKQVSLFKNKIARLERQGYSHTKAVEEAGKIVAIPGTSEHQLGLTVDFVTGNYRKLDEGIKNTKEYQWIEEHAWEYGFVIRYPSGKSDITGIISEPWHLRYVGIPAAKLMTEQEICLEEFLGVAYDGQKNGISNGAGWVNTGR